jgi:hypothetical protein
MAGSLGGVRAVDPGAPTSNAMKHRRRDPGAPTINAKKH